MRPPVAPRLAEKQREKAYPLVLWGGPGSPAAEELVEHLLETAVLPAKLSVDRDGVIRDARPSSVSAMRLATGALLADLFDFHRGAGPHTQPRQGYHGMSKTNFSRTDLGFAHGIFKDVVEPLVAAGLLFRTNGGVVWAFADGRFDIIGSSKTCFGLTDAIIEVARQHRVSLVEWGTHWTRFAEGRSHPVSDAPRLVLRQTRVREGRRKLPSKDQPFDQADPIALKLLRDVERLNSYLKTQSISGLAFPGLRRIFNNGEVSDYAWDKGGRYYTVDLRGELTRDFHREVTRVVGMSLGAGCGSSW